MTGIRVVKPGLTSTVQDLGRPGYGHLGISAAGAADTLALRAGNRLVGNDDGAAGVEMTLLGATFEFDTATTVALTGGEFAAQFGGRQLVWWQALYVPAGERLEIGPSRTGARCYLCVRGGITVPPVLGSQSTHVMSGVGGLAGRRLQAGDVLPIGPAPPREPCRDAIAAELLRHFYAPGPIRVTPGPQAGHFTAGAWTQFTTQPFAVSEQSDRVGIRLTGPALARLDARDIPSEGVSLGAIQVPPNGQPIILFVDHQTTGGYPKIANVCTADLPRVAQLRPRDSVRFTHVSFEAAEQLRVEYQARMARLVTGGSAA
jgi:antagonist of KipI